MSERIFLYDYQVPDLPKSELWEDHLRWMICVLNHDDTVMEFLASVFAQCLKRGSLTSRQAKACTKIFDRIKRDFDAGVLDCQNNNEADDELDLSPCPPGEILQ